MSKKLEIPVYALNPFTKTVSFEWFLSILDKIKDNKINLFVLQNENYKSDRRKHGKLIAKMNMRKLSDVVSAMNGVQLVGQYENNILLVAANDDISAKVMSLSEDDTFKRVFCVATAIKDEDNAVSSLNRCLLTLNITRKNGTTYKLI